MAGGANVGSLNIDVTAGTASFDKAMEGVQRSARNMAKTLEGIGARSVDLGKKLSIGLTLPIAGIAAAAVKGAQAQKAAMAQVESAITSMGNKAGLSGEQLSKFADGLELKSLFDADEILKKSTANLLTFGNIAGESFKGAQQAAVDLATRMGGDLQGATIMIGKALNDPVKGLSALSKAGIQFTDQQKAQIKAMQEGGNMAGAQAIMLKELQAQFGGSAAAAAKADPMREVMVKLGQAGDIIGEKLLPLLPAITDGIVKLLDGFTSLSPAMQQTVIVGGGIAAALGPVVSTFGGLALGVAKVIPVMAKLPLLFKEGSLLMKAWPILLNGIGVAFRFMLGPVGLAITAAGALYLAWKNWDKITAVVSDLYNGVKTWLGDKLGKVLDWVGGKVKALVEPFKYLWDKVVGHSWVPDLVDGIQAEFARLDAVMVKPVTDATTKAEQAFRDMQEKVGGILDSLYPQARAYREELEKLATIEGAKGMDPALKDDAVMRQRQRVADAAGAARAEVAIPDLEGLPNTQPGDMQPLPGLPSATPSIGGLERMNEVGMMLRDTFAQIGGKAGNALADITDSLLSTVIPALQQTGQQADAMGNKFATMAQGLTSIFTAIFGKKAGGILGAITQIGFAIAGFREKGGPVSAGKAYVVGEKRPEVFVPNTAGRIIPDITGIARARVGLDSFLDPGHMRMEQRPIKILVEASPYFNATVDQRAARVAQPMAVAAAGQGSQGAQVALARANSRRIPGQ